MRVSELRVAVNGRACLAVVVRKSSGVFANQSGERSESQLGEGAADVR